MPRRASPRCSASSTFNCAAPCRSLRAAVVRCFPHIQCLVRCPPRTTVSRPSRSPRRRGRARRSVPRLCIFDYLRPRRRGRRVKPSRTRARRPAYRCSCGGATRRPAGSLTEACAAARTRSHRTSGPVASGRIQRSQTSTGPAVATVRIWALRRRLSGAQARRRHGSESGDVRGRRVRAQVRVRDRVRVRAHVQHPVSARPRPVRRARAISPRSRASARAAPAGRRRPPCEL